MEKRLGPSFIEFHTYRECVISFYIIDLWISLLVTKLVVIKINEKI